MKTIVMKFSGPLQSWGTGSNFETRHTDFYPSKSAVIGMISAGFGYRRDDDIAIRRLNELSFGVRIDQRGSLLRDYHIAQKYKINGNFERTYEQIGTILKMLCLLLRYPMKMIVLWKRYTRH